MAVIIIIGSNLYQAGKINLGDITSFLLYMMQILMNFMILAAVVGSIAQVIGASAKIVELLEYEPDIKTTGGSKLDEDCVGRIVLKDVVFSYPTKKDV
jgi:ABC-type multidrug transport system fused ATPase/permease subunit